MEGSNMNLLDENYTIMVVYVYYPPAQTSRLSGHIPSQRFPYWNYTGDIGYYHQPDVSTIHVQMRSWRICVIDVINTRRCATSAFA